MGCPHGDEDPMPPPCFTPQASNQLDEGVHKKLVMVLDGVARLRVPSSRYLEYAPAAEWCNFISEVGLSGVGSANLALWRKAAATSLRLQAAAFLAQALSAG